MKRLVNTLLSVSLAAFLAFSLSGCKNKNDISSENSETESTVSASSVSLSETETTPQPSETELTETTEETEQQTSETKLTETSSLEAKLSVSAPTEEKSIYQQCIDSFTAEKAGLGAEYIYDTAVYDIDNDGYDDLLILYYGTARGSDLHVYKMYDNSFVYCGCIYGIMCKLNERIKDFPVYTSEFYNKIEIKKYNYNGEEYNILLFSYSTYAANYNYIVALDIDENNEIQEIPILSWGIDIKIGAKGEEIVPHNYFYLTADGEKEISDEEVQQYLSYIS